MRICLVVVVGVFLTGMCGVGFAGEQVMDNGVFVVTVKSGAAGVAVTTKGINGKATQLELVFRGKNGVPAALGKVDNKKSDDGESTVHFVAGDCDVVLSLGEREPFVTLDSSSKDCSVEVRVKTCYTVLPDLFGYDLVYDPSRFKGDRISVPAENFFLNLIEGNSAMVMCVWPNSDNKEKATKDPLVELLMAGEGVTRRVTGSRIEFVGRSVYVAVMEAKDIWYAQDVSKFQVQSPTRLEWKRPYDAQWRINTVVAEGKQSKDLMTRSQSYELLYKPADLKRSNEDPHKRFLSIEKSKVWSKGHPRVSEERTYQHIYPAWFDKKSTWVAMYSDNARNVMLGRVKATKDDNVYDLVVFYPLDRGKNTPEDTPMDVFTPTDIMRNTLGKGPCEYVIDLEGIKPVRSSGTKDRKLVGNATCSIWKDYVNRRLGPLRKKEKLSDKNKAELIIGIEDAGIFLHAVYDRIMAYNKFNDDFLAFAAESKEDTKVKVIAERVGVISDSMKAMLVKYDLEKFKERLDYCDETTVEISAQLNDGTAEYNPVQKLGQSFRKLGQAQDNAVSDCRRYVKSLRHEVSFVESSVPEVVAFVAAVRDKCAGILRRAHPKELLHSDSSMPRAHPDRDPDWE